MKSIVRIALGFALFSILLTGTTVHASMLQARAMRRPPQKPAEMGMMVMRPMQTIPEGASPEEIQRINDENAAQQQKDAEDAAKREQERLAPYYAQVRAYNAATVRINEKTKDDLRIEISQALIQPTTKQKITFLNEYLQKNLPNSQGETVQLLASNSGDQSTDAEINEQEKLIPEISEQEKLEVKNNTLGEVLIAICDEVYPNYPALYPDLHALLTTANAVPWINKKTQGIIKLAQLIPSNAPSEAKTNTIKNKGSTGAPKKAQKAKKETTNKKHKQVVKKKAKQAKKLKKNARKAASTEETVQETSSSLIQLEPEILY